VLPKTWADRPEYVGPPAAIMRCPCCGRMRSADSIVLVPVSVRVRAQARFGLLTEPEYLCGAALETLKRERLVTRFELPRVTR